MNLQIISIIVIVSLIMSVLAFMLIVWVFIELKSMQKSTHNIQYVPLEDPSDSLMDKIFKKDKKKQPIIDETDVELFGDDFGDDI